MLPSFQVSIGGSIEERMNVQSLWPDPQTSTCTKHQGKQTQKGYAKLVIRPLFRLVTFGQLPQDEFINQKK